jgi:hypothetical protein
VRNDLDAPRTHVDVGTRSARCEMALNSGPPSSKPSEEAIPLEHRPRSGDVLPAGAVRVRMTEADFQRSVEQLAAVRGWVTLVLPSYVLRCPKGHPVHWGRSVLPGWTDLMLFRPPRRIAWECKSATGRATQAQLDLLVLLTECGFEARIIRPSDMEWIEGALA